MRVEILTLPGWVFDLPDDWTPVPAPEDVGALFTKAGRTSHLLVAAYDEPAGSQFSVDAFLSKSKDNIVLFSDQSDPTTSHSLSALNTPVGTLIAEQRTWQVEDRMITITATMAAHDYPNATADLARLLGCPERVDPPIQSDPKDTQ